MPDLPRRRVVCNSIGVPTEETSDEGLNEAVTRYLQEHPLSGGGGSGPAPDPGDITVYFENGLAGP